MCESFDHLFALLEEKKGEMTLRINSEQEEKLGYIRGLRRKYSDHLDTTAKLLETAIQTLDESEMAVFLQVSRDERSLTCELRFSQSPDLHQFICRCSHRQPSRCYRSEYSPSVCSHQPQC